MQNMPYYNIGIYVVFKNVVVNNVYSYDMFNGINKDESIKCLEKAEKYIKNNQFELAEQFLLKSKKLFSFQRTDGKYLYKNIF